MLLLRRARLLDLRTATLGEPTDVLVDDTVAAVGPRAAGMSDPSRRTPDGFEELDLDGRILMPGLWDEHVHVNQWALASRRFSLSQDAEPQQVLAEVAEHAARRDTGSTDDDLIGFGFRASTWPHNPTAADLDAVSGQRPTILVSADLHSTWCNTAALAKYGLEGSGFLREQASFDLQTRLSDVDPLVLDGWVASCGAAAAKKGIVGIRDMEFSTDIDTWLRREESRRCLHRVDVAVYPERLDEAVAAGLRTGQKPSPCRPDGRTRVAMGPLKIISDGSMSTRTAWCCTPYPGAGGPQKEGIDSVPPAELTSLMERAHRAGLECAVHAIGDRAVEMTLDSFEATGARGSMEHAQLVRDEDIPRFATLGVTASVQPLHMVDDRDSADVMWADRVDRAFRFHDLLQAGASLVFGSDCPVSPVDPWAAVRMAVERTADHRPPWHPEQAVSMSQALLASTRHVPMVEAGGPGNVIAVGSNPFELRGGTLAGLTSDLTVVGGEVTASAL